MASARPAPTALAPWAISSWRPLFWQAEAAPLCSFRHLGTRITFPGGGLARTAGQTLWGGNVDEGDAGVAWDWVQISRGVVTMSDPMSVVSNLRLVSPQGAVLTALQSVVYLNALVHALPWQSEVERALRGTPS